MTFYRRTLGEHREALFKMFAKPDFKFFRLFIMRIQNRTPEIWCRFARYEICNLYYIMLDGKTSVAYVETCKLGFFRSTLYFNTRSQNRSIVELPPASIDVNFLSATFSCDFVWVMKVYSTFVSNAQLLHPVLRDPRHHKAQCYVGKPIVNSLMTYSYRQ